MLFSCHVLRAKLENLPFWIMNMVVVVFSRACRNIGLKIRQFLFRWYHGEEKVVRKLKTV